MEKNHNTCNKIVCSVNKDSAREKSQVKTVTMPHAKTRYMNSIIVSTIIWYLQRLHTFLLLLTA